MKKYILAKTKHVNKCQSVLVSKFGLYWFKKLSEIEFKQHHGNVVRLEQNVKDDSELKDLVLQEQTTYDMYDMPQYRWILIPDFKDG